ncbi:unnamed protein product [Caenorhabditis bovis]|uniref:Potassium channel domain-containing protein n=1 Tax=Caenorhabditis bovis TaxID=2654633 RepID=A0A8S1EY56_9PELO|nr:unnamed protein product [Caenorhabditis bovis]
MIAITLVAITIFGSAMLLLIENVGDSTEEFSHSKCIRFAQNSSLMFEDIIEELDECLKSISKINSFERAFFFSWTIHSTIGYGNFYPHTAGGRLWSVLYAVAVIPFYIALKFEFGTLIARFMLFLANKGVEKFLLDDSGSLTNTNLPVITTRCMPMNVMECEKEEIEMEESLMTPTFDTPPSTANVSHTTSNNAQRNE